ncbi:MAG: glycosyltransferase family 2 protein [Promethearchaeota archaeon]
MKKMKSNKPIYVFMPACDEEKKIGEVIRGLSELELNLKIHVIDDGSVDGTAESAMKAGAMVLRHPANLGQWAALRTGFAVSLMEGADVVVSIDADGQHDPGDLGMLVEPILSGEADMVVGSRFFDGEKPRMPRYRYVGIRFFNKLVEMLTREKLTDCLSGYKAYNMSLVRKVLPHLKEDQYGALEFLVKALRHEAKVVEKPIKTKPNSDSQKGRLKFGYNLLRTIIKESFEQKA